MSMAQDNGGNLVWFVAGVAIGATVALLYAPQSGRDTRRFIGKRAKRSTEAMSDAGRDLMEKGRDLYDKGRKVADEAAELFERGRRIVER